LPLSCLLRLPSWYSVVGMLITAIRRRPTATTRTDATWSREPSNLRT
jgi:hypothetical protein